MEEFRYKEIMLLHSDYPNSKNLTVGGAGAFPLCRVSVWFSALSPTQIADKKSLLQFTGFHLPARS